MAGTVVGGRALFCAAPWHETLSLWPVFKLAGRDWQLGSLTWALAPFFGGGVARGLLVRESWRTGGRNGGACFVPPCFDESPVGNPAFYSATLTPCSPGFYALSRSILAAPAGCGGRAVFGLAQAFFPVHGLAALAPAFLLNAATHAWRGNGVDRARLMPIRDATELSVLLAQLQSESQTLSYLPLSGFPDLFAPWGAGFFFFFFFWVFLRPFAQRRVHCPLQHLALKFCALAKDEEHPPFRPRVPF